MPKSIPKDENYITVIGRDTVVLSHKWRRLIGRHVMKLGVADAHWAILDKLARFGDGISQQEISIRLGLEKSALVRVLNDMEGLALITRNTCERDGRQRLVFLTALGRERAAEVFEKIVEFEAPILETVSKKDLETFHRVITRFTQKLDEIEATKGE